MTIEELEIIVEASIEPAIKEIKKLMPQIKQQVTQAVEVAQKSMEQVDMKSVGNKIQRSIQLVKSKIENLKKSSQNNEIAIKVNNKEAKSQISQIQKEIDSLQKKINERELKLNITNGALDKIRNETRQGVIKDMPDAGAKRTNQYTELRLYQNNDYVALEKQSDKLNSEIIRYNALLESAKSKMEELGQETSQVTTTQSKLSSFFNTFKEKIKEALSSIVKIISKFSMLPKITQNITNNIKNMGSGIKTSLKNVVKYAAALFSLRSIYTTLSSSANSWLSSQNAGAQQLSANIEYMKYAMGSVFAPVIEYVINLVYKLMKAIQSLVYAFSGINIFAKATASSMNKTASSANKASKSLAGVHNEINNVSENDNGSGSGTTNPSFDLSGIDSQMSPLAQKLYEFFKPLKESWDTYGGELVTQLQTTASQVVGLISSVWGSLENIITNGTVYSILENILAIIGNIAEAFENAWNYNNNGDAIVQNLANAFNNLLVAINNVVQSEGFQNWLNNCSDKFREISEKIAEIDWQPLIETLTAIGTTIGTIALDVLSGLTDVFKWLVEHPEVSEFLAGIAIAIGLISAAISIYTTAMGVYNVIMPIATAVSTAFGISIGWLIAIVALIVVAIGLAVVAIVELVKHWDEIKETVIRVCDQIKEKVSEWVTSIKEWFSNLIETVKTAWNDFWSGLFTKVSEIVNNIKSTISTWIDNIKTKISNVLNSIKNTWNNIWTGLGNTISNVWNGIWNTIKRVINWILGGIETFANGIVKGINKVLSGLSGIANAAGDVIGLDIKIQPMSTISIPRLAKGNVAYSPMIAQFGEYVGASTNPEITTPQNIMRDTFEDVLSDFNGNNGQPLHVTIQYLGKEIFDDTIDYINEKTRRTGKCVIKVT